MLIFLKLLILIDCSRFFTKFLNVLKFEVNVKSKSYNQCILAELNRCEIKYERQLHLKMFLKINLKAAELEFCSLRTKNILLRLLFSFYFQVTFSFTHWNCVKIKSMVSYLKYFEEMVLFLREVRRNVSFIIKYWLYKI